MVLQLIDEELTKIKRQVTVKQKNNRKNHHTPTWLAEAIRLAVKNLYVPTMVDENSSIVVESKGGTLDVGTHTGITRPDTVYATLWSLLDFLIQDRELACALRF